MMTPSSQAVASFSSPSSLTPIPNSQRLAPFPDALGGEDIDEKKFASSQSEIDAALAQLDRIETGHTPRQPTATTTSSSNSDRPSQQQQQQKPPPDSDRPLGDVTDLMNILKNQKEQLKVKHERRAESHKLNFASVLVAVIELNKIYVCLRVICLSFPSFYQPCLMLPLRFVAARVGALSRCHVGHDRIVGF
jgi:hypothetical protein